MCVRWHVCATRCESVSSTRDTSSKPKAAAKSETENQFASPRAREATTKQRDAGWRAKRAPAAHGAGSARAGRRAGALFTERTPRVGPVRARVRGHTHTALSPSRTQHEFSQSRKELCPRGAFPGNPISRCVQSQGIPANSPRRGLPSPSLGEHPHRGADSMDTRIQAGSCWSRRGSQGHPLRARAHTHTQTPWEDRLPATARRAAGHTSRSYSLASLSVSQPGREWNRGRWDYGATGKVGSRLGTRPRCSR
ncbi:microtubule-associated protein 6-like [Nycticebus coucang]|uniref:microtubule-associated protein 6-like n=1 Tax=Nycticebus coucang TaxID=9470 RepID=UPI00234C0B99|nr:microtubule-associated protein 6-like [Nycticebus coucang]